MPRRPIQNRQVENQPPSGPHQFQFNIAEADGIDDQRPDDAGVTAQPQKLQNLTSEQLQQLFKRANTELIAEQTDKQNFFKREATLKAPKTSKHIQTAFPPPPPVHRPEDLDLDPEKLQQLAKEKAGPLMIERYAPNETLINQPVAAVTVTFSQPMVAVATLDDHVHVEPLGISLTPQP